MSLLLRQNILVVKAKVEGFTLTCVEFWKLNPGGKKTWQDKFYSVDMKLKPLKLLPCIRQSAAHCPSLKPHAGYRIPQVVVIKETQHNSHKTGFHNVKTQWGTDLIAHVTKTCMFQSFQRRLNCHIITRICWNGSGNVIYSLTSNLDIKSDQCHLNCKQPWHISFNALFS